MKPFITQNLPLECIDFDRLIILIAKANRNISLYSGLLEAIPNTDILMAPMTIQEAVISSKIEGTQASFSEVLKHEAGEKYEYNKTADIQEILNYKDALLEAENLFKTKPFIHINMIKKLHEILLSGVRGENKSRGNFRTIQNYIGQFGCQIEDATYIPPEPQNILPALDNLEKFINIDDQEILIQLAIIHAQFELIHPFLDGNGRIGRILIPLFLVQKQYLKKPIFYLSEYFENNRGLYYEKLNNISRSNDWNSWIEFFLNAICAQAENNSKKVRSMINLYEEMKEKFVKITHSEFAIKMLDVLFIDPIISTIDLTSKSGIESKRSGRLLIQKLIESNVLTVYKQAAGPKPAIIAFSELVNLAEGRHVF